MDMKIQIQGDTIWGSSVDGQSIDKTIRKIVREELRKILKEDAVSFLHALKNQISQPDSFHQ